MDHHGMRAAALDAALRPCLAPLDLGVETLGELPEEALCGEGQGRLNHPPEAQVLQRSALFVGVDSAITRPDVLTGWSVGARHG